MAKLQMVLKNPESYDLAGNVTVRTDWLEWEDCRKDFVTPEGAPCEHGYNCCRDCVDSWRTDWMFRLVDDDGNVMSYADLLTLS